MSLRGYTSKHIGERDLKNKFYIVSVYIILGDGVCAMFISSMCREVQPRGDKEKSIDLFWEFVIMIWER